MTRRPLTLVAASFALLALACAGGKDEGENGGENGGGGNGGTDSGGGDNGGDNGGNGGGDTDEPEDPPCYDAGFAAAPSAWSIPFPAQTVQDDGTVIDWTLRDMDGDGYVDLVNTVGDAPVGVSSWEVYRGGPGGFPDSPDRWAIPFPATTTWDSGTTVEWSILDVDGDGYIDLLDATGDRPTGTTQWDFYAGGPDGFAATAAAWNIPFPAESVWDDGTVIDWTILDVDGDGWIDLLNAVGAAPTGVSRWELYPGGPDGFAATATSWSIPFPAETVWDSGTTVDWTIRDMDGDGYIDLVNTVGAGSVGVTSWEVYPGGPDGFADAPDSWSIPFPAESAWDSGSTVEWTILDANDDGWVDLLDATGDPPVGVSEWAVYWGGAGGFADAPISWATPFPTESVWDAGTSIDWTILDVDGDGLIDLLNAAGDPPTGVSRWELYAGTCAE